MSFPQLAQYIFDRKTKQNLIFSPLDVKIIQIWDENRIPDAKLYIFPAGNAEKQESEKSML